MTGYSDSVYRDVPWAGRTLRVRVDYWAKPIPLRQFDYQATDDATYDGPGCPIGHGATEEAAIADLLIELEIYEGEPPEDPPSDPADDDGVRHTRQPYMREKGE